MLHLTSEVQYGAIPTRSIVSKIFTLDTPQLPASAKNKCMFWSLQCCYKVRDGVSNHQPQDCLLNRLFRRRSKEHQRSASLASVRGIHRWPVKLSHRGSVTRKMTPFDDVIMILKSYSLAVITVSYVMCYELGRVTMALDCIHENIICSIERLSICFGQQ